MGTDEAKPMDWCCEHGDCNSNQVKDYERNKEDCDGTDWDTEPIALCALHSLGHKLIGDVKI